jgi:ribosomal protein S12 methylthiotransferase
MKESVYVKISEGCNNRCSYCAIPLIRGSFVSRSMDEIVDEVKGLIANGAYEINLISQDTTNYGIDLYKEYKIVELLRRITELDGNFKVRLLYLYPNLVSDELIDFIAGSDKVYPYFDIPLQHSETKILKSMNRRGDKEFIINLLNKIRTKIPHAILRTTMIVGFPGEEEEDFNNLVEFIKEMKFDRLGAFSYSPEEDTVGATMPNQIASDVKEARLSALYLAQDMIAEEANSKQIGTVSEVLIVDYDADSYAYIGRNYAFAPDDIDGFIFVYSANELKIGDVVKVKILDASINTLSGEVIFDEA